MISDLLFRKKLGIPYISIIFIFCCLLVSIPTYFFPRLYFVFGSSFQGYNDTYIWQNAITSQFEHGSFYIESKIAQGLPLLVHLFGNVIIIGVFGSLTERILGTRRFLQLTIIAALCNYIIRVLIDSYGNGASGIAWAYGSIAFLILIRTSKLYGNRLLRDPMFYISDFLFVMMWIVITAGSEWTTILFHLIATLVGIVFYIIYKIIIYERLNKIIINHDSSVICNKRIIIGCLLMPMFLMTLLILAYMYIL